MMINMIHVVDVVVGGTCRLRRRVARVVPWDARRRQRRLRDEMISRAKGRGENRREKKIRGEGNGIKKEGADRCNRESQHNP